MKLINNYQILKNKDNDIYPVLENDIRKDNQSIQKAQSGIFEFFNLMLQRKEIVAVDEKMVIDEMFKILQSLLPIISGAKTCVGNKVPKMFKSKTN